jgi:hypothetical protein
MINFKNFTTNKSIFIINNLSDKNYIPIKKFFKNERNIKFYDKNFDGDKILSLNPKLIVDINEDKQTKGIYINSSKSIFDKTKKMVLNLGEIPIIGKHQSNKNKKFELDLFKRGIPYIYIEFPSRHFKFNDILKTQLIFIKRLIKAFN